MPDTPLPSVAEPSGTAAIHSSRRNTKDIDELERRLAAFDQATKRLAHLVAPTEPRVTLPVPTSDFIGYRDMPDEPIGVRQTVSTGTTVTGALTARRQQAIGTRPGFTSSIGRPPIAPASPPPVSAHSAVRITTDSEALSQAEPTPTPTRRWPLLVGGGVVTCVLGLWWFLPGLFPVCPDGSVIARIVTVESPASGVLAELSVPVGSSVKAGAVIGRVDRPANVALGEPEQRNHILAPVDGSVSERLVAVGRQVVQGERICSLALPNTASVVASLSTAVADRVAVGDRVEVLLIAEQRAVDGTVARILLPGEQSDGVRTASSVADLRPQLVIELDPSPLPLRPGQGVRVTILGPRPGAFRMLLFHLRGYLPR